MPSDKDRPTHGGVSMSESEVHSIDRAVSSSNVREWVPPGLDTGKPYM